MIGDLLIQSQSEREIANYLTSPGQNIGLIGSTWLYNGLIAEYMSTQLLDIPPAKLTNYPYLMRLSNDEAKSIGIDSVRQINNFIRLKVPVKSAINRIIIIDQADKLTLEAQNALLKSLEEPPRGTVFMLIASASSILLPTISSRLQQISLKKPLKSQTVHYFSEQGFDSSEIEQAYLICNGLPELMASMLKDHQHPLNQATATARQILSGGMLERMNAVNDLAKDKQQFLSIVFIVKQMSKIGLSSKDASSAKKWRKILSACLESELKLNANTQLKLVITNFMLSIA